jgi:hypothetical protein
VPRGVGVVMFVSSYEERFLSNSNVERLLLVSTLLGRFLSNSNVERLLLVSTLLERVQYNVVRLLYNPEKSLVVRTII